MTSADLSRVDWKKSRRSNGQANCVEVACGLPGMVAVRDSKHPDGPNLIFTHDQWGAFLTEERRGTVAR